MKRIFCLVLLTIFFCLKTTAEASDGKILFIPHDDRPISYRETVDVVEQAGVNLILPPKELLSSAKNDGQPDELWKWLEENAPFVKSAVISSDSMLYGGLIPSRKHEVPADVLNERLGKFEQLRKKNPALRMYVFDSLMRTPQVGTKGDIEEPPYYAEYGADIFIYTKLIDKKEISELSSSEENYLDSLEKKIPAEFMKDWMERRKKNLSATKKLMDLTRDGTVDYLILGRDDNSPLCQTHKENREILSYAEKNNLPKSKFQSLPGIDEFNILLLNRAINDMTGEIPFVNVRYNKGVGGDTVPDFSDEKISASIDAALAIAGGLKVPNPKNADFVLLVNTDPKGKTIQIHNPYPSLDEFEPMLKPNGSTKYFAKLVEEYVEKNYPVGIADINFANGSDNALMKILHEKDLLFKLQAYSGWNTATNSTGFVLGIGMLARKMTDEGREKLLTTRYLEDWGYQANVRTIVGKELLKNFEDSSLYYQLGDKLSFAEERNNILMRDFAEKNLSLSKYTRNFTVKNPWLRMFECEIIFDK